VRNRCRFRSPRSLGTLMAASSIGKRGDAHESRRREMVSPWIAAHGISDKRVLAAMGDVPRHAFVPEGLEIRAYEDAPLPIGSGQTISQPYVVARMLEALELSGDERVLEVGTGSGYAAAVLSKLAREVHTVERIGELARAAAERLMTLGYANVHVHEGDGSQGWVKAEPYDAIVVAAAGPRLPRDLLRQLAEGGRLVMPVGEQEGQVLVRIRRVDGGFETEDLEMVRFVPLIGVGGWPEETAKSVSELAHAQGVPGLIRECSEPIEDIDEVDLAKFLDRVGSARVVLLGEATHGTAEFYRMRTRVTRELVLRRGFDVVAVEADWPDASRVDRYVRSLPPTEHHFTPFARFPTWIWRNREAHELVEWLRACNAERLKPPQRVAFFGLDLYSLFTSAQAVIAYLRTIEPPAAKAAIARYGLLTPWQLDPAAYGQAVLAGRAESCEDDVVTMLRELLERRIDYARRDGYRFFDAAQNARLVVDAERYYRAMYRGARESWNLRDQHMFETLNAILDERGPSSKAIIWAHNTHCGDAAATEMGRRGEINLGLLCRQHFGDDAYAVGFGTDHGTVVAAHDWDAPGEIVRVRPAHALSHERLFHESKLPALLLPLRQPVRETVRDELSRSRLERAIGVVYRPETEVQSHYFEARLAQQFDEFVWFDRTQALEALPTPEQLRGMPDTYPFGL
jgi:protein-L-isoaspartate(D-aspartate) O-methyltransferase